MFIIKIRFRLKAWTVLFIMMNSIGISILMYIRKYKYISVFVLPLEYWRTCLLGLVAMLRYDFPLIVGIPLYIGMILAANGDLY